MMEDVKHLLKDTAKLMEEVVKKASPVVNEILRSYGIKDRPKVEVIESPKVGLAEIISLKAFAYGTYDYETKTILLNAMRFTVDRINMVNILKSVEGIDMSPEDVAKELTVFSVVSTYLHEVYHFMVSHWKKHEELDWFEKEEIESEADDFSEEWYIPVTYYVYGMDDKKMMKVVKYLNILFRYTDWLSEHPEEAVGYAKYKLAEIGILK